MTTRRSEDLDVPPPEAEVPLPANVREFPLILGLHVVLEMAERRARRKVEIRLTVPV